mmetsp:Transcript_36520/g.61064  ORF Transcript_36520/g.61064 Transcript_36520/m.61064 type:complete len:89 (-) Transcript_36520:2709-2975(-)
MSATVSQSRRWVFVWFVVIEGCVFVVVNPQKSERGRNRNRSDEKTAFNQVQQSLDVAGCSAQHPQCPALDLLAAPHPDVVFRFSWCSC